MSGESTRSHLGDDLGDFRLLPELASQDLGDSLQLSGVDGALSLRALKSKITVVPCTVMARRCKTTGVQK